MVARHSAPRKLTFFGRLAAPCTFLLHGNKIAFIYSLYTTAIVGVRVAQLEEAWTVNHAVGRSSPSWVKQTKSCQQALNPKIAGSFGWRPKSRGPVYHDDIVGTLGMRLTVAEVVGGTEKYYYIFID